LRGFFLVIGCGNGGRLKWLHDAHILGIFGGCHQVEPSPNGGLAPFPLSYDKGGEESRGSRRYRAFGVASPFGLYLLAQLKETKLRMITGGPPATLPQQLTHARRTKWNTSAGFRDVIKNSHQSGGEVSTSKGCTRIGTTHSHAQPLKK